MKYVAVIAVLFTFVLFGGLAEVTGEANAELGKPYTIQAGDNFWDIAQQNDIPLAALIAANPDADPYALRIGQVIVIPGENEPEANLQDRRLSVNTVDDEAGENTNGDTYTIQAGDNLWDIAYRNGIALDALLVLNPDLDPYMLVVGQTVFLSDVPLVTTEEIVPPPSPSGMTLVKTGNPIVAILTVPEIEMDAPLLDEMMPVEQAITAPQIAPMIDVFDLINLESLATTQPTVEAAVVASATPLPEIETVVEPQPVPELLMSNLVPINIKIDTIHDIEMAELSINGVTVAQFNQPPYTYDLDLDMFEAGLYALTFTVQSSSGVVSTDNLEFEVAPIDAVTGTSIASNANAISDMEGSAADRNARARKPEAMPLTVLVDGQNRPLDLIFSPDGGLAFAAPNTSSTVVVDTNESLLEILTRPAGIIPSNVVEALSAQRPELFSIVMIVTTLTLMPQGLFTLYWMLYTWNNPSIAQLYRAPREFTAPQYSFTAILPARHEEDVIADTIRAVDRMNYPDHLKEILIMIRDDNDDGTIAKARETIAELGKTNIRVITFTDGPRNKPNGLNKGLRASTKDVVCVFDAEDEPHADLYNVINTVMKRDGADVVQAGVQLMNFRSSWFSALNCLEYFFWFKSGLHCFTRMFKVTPLGGNTVFFKRHWLERARGWDETCLTEDADIGLRLTQMGAKIQIVYDEEHATQEETPASVDSFIKQRTRWNQGFYQVFFKGDWARMPEMKQRVTALYILLNSLLQAAVVLYLPLGIYIALTQRLPVPVALLSWVPIFMLFLQLVTNLIGMREFTEAYGYKLPFLFRLRMIIVYYPYQLLLAAAAVRALWRMFTNRQSWEKTAHANLHRQSVQVRA